MKLEYRKIKIYKKDKDKIDNHKYLKQLLALSSAWAKEKICVSYKANEESEFINKELYLVLDEDKIIGYGLGHIKKLKDKTSYNQIGEKAFELDELYIKKNYRNKGIGKKLFKYIEKDLKDQVDLIGLVAATKKYKELLKFYIEELDMNFNNAFLFKRMK